MVSEYFPPRKEQDENAYSNFFCVVLLEILSRDIGQQKRNKRHSD
jgi:hypothetical protein